MSESGDPEREEPPPYVHIQGTDVYFHCDVCEATILELNMKLRKLAQDLRHKYMDLGLEDQRPEIRLFIRSDGGDMHSGLSGMDCIRGLNKHVKIRTVADGVCASAATFLLLGGYSRHMTENSYILIHQLNMDGVWGRFEDLKEQMSNLEKFMGRFRSIYSRETQIPERRLHKLLKHDMYLDAKQCVEWGVVDSVQR